MTVKKILSRVKQEDFELVLKVLNEGVSVKSEDCDYFLYTKTRKSTNLDMWNQCHSVLNQFPGRHFDIPCVRLQCRQVGLYFLSSNLFFEADWKNQHSAGTNMKVKKGEIDERLSFYIRGSEFKSASVYLPSCY